MTTGSGIFAQVMAAKESVYGTFVAPTITLEITDESLSQDVSHIESNSLAKGRRVRPTARRIVNPQGAGGDITTEIAVEGMGWLFEACLGASAVTTPDGGTDAREQTFTLGDAPASRTLQVGRPGVGGTVQPFNYLGCVVTDWEIGCKVDEVPTLKTTWDSREEETTSALGTPGTAVPELLVYTGGTVTIGGTEYPVNDLTISGKRAVKTDRRFLGDWRKSTPIANGLHEITAKCTLELDALTIYSLVKSGVPTSFAVAFVGSNIESGSDFGLALTLAECQVDGDTPNLNGMDVVPVNLTFTMLDNGTDEPITLVYTTTDTAVA